MNFTFSITKHTYDTKKEEASVNQEILNNLVNSGIEIDALDGNMIYKKANEIMKAANLESVMCSMEKGDYFFMIITRKDCEELHVIVDKRGVPMPNALVAKKEDLNLEQLVSSY